MRWDIGLIVGHKSAAPSSALLDFVNRFQHEMRQTPHAARRARNSGCPSLS
ncbi:hypothetical protein ABRZ24_21550 [Brenneria populi]|uniref:LysR family transcriptional regulator n=1 Tax=Brenneria populi TaxID=1505588 RepID=A0ABU6JXB3_9GAMM|nr:hypothetical protein [Brenneria populi Li et al. 2015]